MSTSHSQAQAKDQRHAWNSGPRRWTYEELVAEMPEMVQTSELWEGELIMSPTPSFYHQEIAFQVQRALYDWVHKQDLGKVIGAPIDMVLSAHDVTQPDVAFIAKSRLNIIDGVIMGAADLVVEIISLGSRNRDRIQKRDLYEQYGVKEYWIIDPEPATVDVLALVNRQYELVQRAQANETAASRLLPGFKLSLGLLFRKQGQ